MHSHQLQAARGRRGADRLRAGLTAGALVLALGACDSLTDVENPNNVGQEDVQQPSAARAMVSGTLAMTAEALSRVQLAHGAMSDEFTWRGSFNHMNQLDLGIVRDDSNQYTEAAFNDLAAARWMAEETIGLLEGHAAEGNLANRQILGHAYLYSAIVHSTIPDMFEDFTFSDRQEPGPPIGEENMHTVYDVAEARLNSAMEAARASGDPATELAALALRARVRWAKALWHKLNPTVNVADPLIDDAGANADAAAVLAIAPPDYRYRLTFGPSSQQSQMGFNANSRLEIAIANEFVKQDASGRLSCTALNANCREDGTAIDDPIDGMKDPALRQLSVEFIQGGVFSAITVASARELHLILAEAALRRGNLAEFASHINAVRAFQPELSPYDPAVHAALSPLELLKHHRKVNLFPQIQRRLADLYRFGETSPNWIDSGDARTDPGSVFLISRTERQSNCFLNGTC